MLETPGQRDSKKSYLMAGPYWSLLSSSRKLWGSSQYIYIEKHQQLRAKSHSELLKKLTFAAFHPTGIDFEAVEFRSTGTQIPRPVPHQQRLYTIPSTDISMFTLSRDPSKITMGTLPQPDRPRFFYSSTTPRPKSSKSRCIIIWPTGAPRPSELTSAPLPSAPAQPEGKWTEELLRLHGMVLVMVLLFTKNETKCDSALSHTSRPSLSRS